MKKLSALLFTVSVLAFGQAQAIDFDLSGFLKPSEPAPSYTCHHPQSEIPCEVK